MISVLLVLCLSGCGSIFSIKAETGSIVIIAESRSLGGSATSVVIPKDITGAEMKDKAEGIHAITGK